MATDSWMSGGRAGCTGRAAHAAGLGTKAAEPSPDDVSDVSGCHDACELFSGPLDARREGATVLRSTSRRDVACF